MKHSATLSERIAHYSKLDKATGCIHWTGTLAANGYGHIHLPRRGAALVHRVVWMMHNGPIPDTLNGKPAVISHKCANRTCVNEEHLELSTQEDNVNHPVTKQRRKQAVGRRGPNLSLGQIAEIHAMFAAGEKNYSVAKKTNRSESHIGTLRRKYEARESSEARTTLLKDINKRLATLLAKRPRTPRKPLGGGSHAV